MKKLTLKLESLEVTTFETAETDSQARGTLYAHAKPAPITVGCQPTDPRMDCTYGCSQFTGCPDGCGLLTREVDCFESVDCPVTDFC